VKLLTPSAQLAVPGVEHGDDEHSLTSVSQRAPVYPATQAQVKLLTPSEQVPLLRQGVDAHSLILISQKVPE
jgi:hypothetical protein